MNSAPKCSIDSQTFEYIKLATYCLVPFILILSLNVAIIVKLSATTLVLQHRFSHSDVSKLGCDVTNSCCLEDSHSTAGACGDGGGGGITGGSVIRIKSCDVGTFVAKRQVAAKRSNDSDCRQDRRDFIGLTDSYREVGRSLNCEPRGCQTRLSSSPSSRASSGMDGGQGGGPTTTMILSAGNGSSVRTKRQARVTTMLLVVSISWLVLTIPFALFGIIFDGADYATQAR